MPCCSFSKRLNATTRELRIVLLHGPSEIIPNESILKPNRLCPVPPGSRRLRIVISCVNPGRSRWCRACCSVVAFARCSALFVGSRGCGGVSLNWWLRARCCWLRTGTACGQNPSRLCELALDEPLKVSQCRGVTRIRQLAWDERNAKSSKRLANREPRQGLLYFIVSFLLLPSPQLSTTFQFLDLGFASLNLLLVISNCHSVFLYFVTQFSDLILLRGSLALLI